MVTPDEPEPITPDLDAQVDELKKRDVDDLKAELRTLLNGMLLGSLQTDDDEDLDDD